MQCTCAADPSFLVPVRYPQRCTQLGERWTWNVENPNLLNPYKVSGYARQLYNLLNRAAGCPNRAAGDHLRWSMLTPTKVSLVTQWTGPHSLLLNSLAHSRARSL